MTEHLIVAIWRAPGVAPESVAAGIVEQWAPEALTHATVEACTVSLAEPDQGIYTREPDAHGLVPNCDALISLGLTRAHDLDDVPARDVLHALARRVEVWRVDERRPLVWDRDWPDGEHAPGIKLVSFMQRAEGLTHEQFARHWTENHTPLALKHHIGLWNYTQNVVRRSYTPAATSSTVSPSSTSARPTTLSTASSTPTTAAPRSSPTSRSSWRARAPKPP